MNTFTKSMLMATVICLVGVGFFVYTILTRDVEEIDDVKVFVPNSYSERGESKEETKDEPKEETKDDTSLDVNTEDLKPIEQMVASFSEEVNDNLTEQIQGELGMTADELGAYKEDILRKAKEEKVKEYLKSKEESKKNLEEEDLITSLVTKTEAKKEIILPKVEKPKEEVVEVVKDTTSSSKNDKSEVNKKYSKEVNVVATAYDAFCDTGCTGITKSGLDVRYHTPNVIAVDTSVIPLYSIVELYLDGKYYGTYQAVDTGGAIKGNKIDILMKDKQTCIEFGKRNMQVKVLDTTKKQQQTHYASLKQ